MPRGKILVTGRFMPDGYGDEAHLENMLRALKLFLEPQDIKPIMLLSCFADKKPKMIELMKKHHLLTPDTLATDDCFTIHKKNPDIFLMTDIRQNEELKNDESPKYSEEEHDKLRADPDFRKKLADVKLVLNVSNFGMLETLHDEHYGYQDIFVTKPRIVHFPEHGAKVDEKKYAAYFDAQYPMGFKHGMFLEAPEKRSKADILASIQDKQLLSLLLNQHGQDEHEAIKHFIEHDDLFPGYWKSPEAFYTFLLSVVKSSYIQNSNKERLTVFSNVYYQPAENQKKSIDFDNLDYLQCLYEAGIDKLELCTREKIELVDIRDRLISSNHIPKTAVPAHKKFKTMRVINLWAPEEDLDRMYEYADIAGCSGDKTLEKAVARLCLPLYEMRSYKVKEFRKEIEEEFKETALEKILVHETKKVFDYAPAKSEADCIWHKYKNSPPIIQLLNLPQMIEISDGMAQHITPENMIKTKEILRDFVKNKNLYNLLPPIFQKEIQAAMTTSKRLVSELSFLNAQVPEPVNPRPSKRLNLSPGAGIV